VYEPCSNIYPRVVGWKLKEARKVDMILIEKKLKEKLKLKFFKNKLLLQHRRLIINKFINGNEPYLTALV
jgi:hypothetical protein